MLIKAVLGALPFPGAVGAQSRRTGTAGAGCAARRAVSAGVHGASVAGLHGAGQSPGFCPAVPHGQRYWYSALGRALEGGRPGVGRGAPTTGARRACILPRDAGRVLAQACPPPKPARLRRRRRRPMPPSGRCHRRRHPIRARRKRSCRMPAMLRARWPRTAQLPVSLAVHALCHEACGVAAARAGRSSVRAARAPTARGLGACRGRRSRVCKGGRARPGRLASAWVAAHWLHELPVLARASAPAATRIKP